ncbi:MAG: nitrite reductase, copper-containing [Halobacteriovoraceae bacterium]|nr:nitrite reductase, copper-containing [Halobacteriovoraceae bacterium]MCB9095820.1 nitrite reductase, copper-containing [Halobacteriovoraceae bacterium]
MVKSNVNLLAILIIGSFLTILSSCNEQKSKVHSIKNMDSLKRVTQKLVPPPALPEHNQVATGEPKIVQVRLVIEEKKMVIDDEGTEIWAFTYNGTVPGPMIVVHEGDFVEATLVNPETNAMEHNIDFHASTGALGGGGLTHVAPGEEVVLRFRATRPGVFVYHCAPSDIMIPWHVVHGMNGALMVLPREGLNDGHGKKLKYDKAFYVGEQDYYIPKDKNGNYKKYSSSIESMTDDLEVMKSLIPTHIVFNGKVGGLTGSNAMKANVGDTVLILHSQANYDTRPHLIGGHGDYVWERGSFGNPPKRDLETWFIPGGTAGAALYTFRQPGVYAYVNHNLIEAVMKGAVGHFKVEGKWNDELMKQVKAPSPIK